MIGCDSSGWPLRDSQEPVNPKSLPPMPVVSVWRDGVLMPYRVANALDMIEAGMISRKEAAILLDLEE